MKLTKRFGRSPENRGKINADFQDFKHRGFTPLESPVFQHGVKYSEFTRGIKPRVNFLTGFTKRINNIYSIMVNLRKSASKEVLENYLLDSLDNKLQTTPVCQRDRDYRQKEKRYKGYFLVFLFYSFLSVVCASRSNVKAENLPQRIISLAPSITESLYELGAQDNLIGVTSYCDYPLAAKEKEKVGTIINPNIEKIVSLSPDLVLAMDDSNRLQTIEKLKELGIKVIVLKECRDFDDIADNFIRLGNIVGKEDNAQKIIAASRKILEDISGNIKSHAVRIFWEVNAKPLVTVGSSTFTNSIIELCGGINLFNDVNSKYPRISCEEVLLRNPQIIILVTMGDVTEEEKSFWQKFKQIDAVRDNAIYVLDADLVCRPTVSRFVEGVKKVAGILYHNE